MSLRRAGHRSFLLLLAALTSCTQVEPPAPAAAAVEKAAVAIPVDAPPEPAHPVACTLVTPQEMSQILGTPMSAERPGGVSETRCIYKGAKETDPYVEFTIEWGHGQGAMNMARLAVQAKPDVAQAYGGIGDEAAMLGATLLIRNGEDLVTLVMFNVQNLPAKARRVFDTAKPRM